MREMKDSGIEWIGEIPKEWDILRLKYCFSGFTNGTSDTQLSSGESLYPVTRIETISSGEINLDKIGYVAFSKKQYLLKTGDILVSNINSIKYLGNCAVVRDGYRLYHGMNLLRVVPGDYIDNGYAYYLFKSNVFKFPMEKYCKPAINQASVSATTMKNFFIPFPDLVVQQQIANFLDTKCSEIDATAEDIQKEISLLEDYKKSVITEAVTKGLNPDAEMKDSKIFYLGQINKTWNLTKVGYCCKKLYRPFEPSDEALVCSNKGKVVPRGDTLIGLMTSDDNAMQGICKGDIAIHGMDTWHGAIACSEYDGKITRVVHVCKADGDNRFVVYWLQHLAFVGVYKLISNGVRGNTSDFRSWDKVADIYVPNPIKEEQQQIADFIDTKCSEIDTLIADKKRQLDILADYKKSLIYEYVTGKKEVSVNE